jgi:excisionase family DNA binding protein
VAVRSRTHPFSPNGRRGGGLGGTRAVRVPPMDEVADSGASLLLRPVDVATALGISRSKVFELLAAQELPSVHIGRSTRIPRAQLEEWIQGQVCWQPQAPAGLLGRLRTKASAGA